MLIYQPSINVFGFEFFCKNKLLLYALVHSSKKSSVTIGRPRMTHIHTSVMFDSLIEQTTPKVVFITIIKLQLKQLRRMVRLLDNFGVSLN